MNIPSGAYVPPKPPLKPGGLVGAANPWGLSTSTPAAKGISTLAHAAAAPVHHVSAATAPVIGRPAGSLTAGLNPGGAMIPYAQGTATGGAYDLSGDPAVLAATASGNEGDQQAQASALAQRQQLLLQYGDPNLINSLLGDSTLAQAAGANQNSTLAQLAHTRDTNLKTLDDNLNASNLIYSGNRVVQEGQQSRDYQSALAQAAAAVQGGLGSIQSGLTAEEGQTAQQKIQALSDAATRAMEQAIASGTDPGAAAQSVLGGAAGGGGLTKAALGAVSSGIGGHAKQAAKKAAAVNATNRIVAH